MVERRNGSPRGKQSSRRTPPDRSSDPGVTSSIDQGFNIHVYLKKLPVTTSDLRAYASQ